MLDDSGKDTGQTVYLVKADPEEVSASLGSEFFGASIVALGFGLVGIFLFIAFRYELSFAVGGIIALFHDVLITIGAVVLFGGELSLIHVGAILTVAGYSINDTIVVFDRIRENLRSHKGTVAEVMNGAINATLSRTILTSLTTIITVTILSIFGGAALKDFSVMILIGLVAGTFSSIYVAAPIVLWWSQLRGSNLRREILDANLEAEINPAR
jgi:SecD/SecF fusion protein